MFFLHACFCTTGLKFQKRLEEGIRSPGSGVTDGCEPPCGYGELNPGPLEEQPVLLTTDPLFLALSGHLKNPLTDVISLLMIAHNAMKSGNEGGLSGPVSES